MQKKQRECVNSQKVENGFVVRIGKTIYRKVSKSSNAYHNEIALKIIQGNEKLHKKYQRSNFFNQPAIFLVTETPAIMVATGTLKRISYNPNFIEEDKEMKKIVAQYKKRGYKELPVFF